MASELRIEKWTNKNLNERCGDVSTAIVGLSPHAKVLFTRRQTLIASLH